MKKKLLLPCLLAIAGIASAYDYPYLTIVTADGQSKSLAAEGLTLNVADGRLTAANTDGTVAFTLTDLAKMYFSTADAGVQLVIDETEEVDVYNLYGVRLGRYTALSAARRALASGIYIVKSGSRTQKIIVE